MDIGKRFLYIPVHGHFSTISVRLTDIASQAASLDQVSPGSSVMADVEDMRLRVAALTRRAEEIVLLITLRIEQHRYFLK